ncbi:hypothetical protein BdWA1_001398 [Babesia duncani]|uniref:Uncharacterized protein n=1 Tax=Babesia duncani TaxID=323732 RepID=A0AAD9UQR8_9APIC|nr:hypothetical protein BdWA1_001398 [Babesia duncani]
MRNVTQIKEKERDRFHVLERLGNVIEAKGTRIGFNLLLQRPVATPWLGHDVSGHLIDSRNFFNFSTIW